MMPGRVDPYFNHRHAQPTPPPPTPPMHPNPPSSSALSPLARPFTLDYVFSSPPPPPPSRYHTLPPVSPPAADRPSAPRLPLFAFATGSLLSQRSSGAVGDPCRARYCSDTQPWAFEPSSSFSGGGAEPWNGPFDAAVGRGKRTDVVSPWAEAAEPSLDYLAPSFPEVVFINASIVAANINSIPVLNGNNFKTWKNKLTMVLECLDLDLAFRESCPAPLTDQSTPEVRRLFERWDRSNRVSLMVMKNAVPEMFQDFMSEETNAKRFLDTLEKHFAKSDKVEISATLRKLVSMRYKGNGSIREYILEMFHLSVKLKTLNIEISEDLLVHLVLISLPSQFGPFEMRYNCLKDKWTINELISHLVEEEERMRQNKIQSSHLALTSSGCGQKRKGKEIAVTKPQKKHKNTSQGQKKKRCFFCKDFSHTKKDCTKYHAQRAQKELAADCCSHYDNDSYGIWHGKFADQMTEKKPFGSQSPQWTQDKHSENFTQGLASSYSIFGDPFSTPSALLGVHYSEAVSSTSEMGSHDSFASNPCDAYMAQLDSCTLNRLAFDPSSTCSTSSQAYAPSNFRATSKINSATSSVTVHELPYKSSDSLIIPSRSKEVNVNQSLGGSQGGYDEKIREEHDITKSAVTLSSEHRGNNFPSNYPTIGSPLNLSVFIPELSLKKVVISDASPSRRSSMEPDKFFNSSLDALDQHNLAIDSPCWKGTPSSRQSPCRIAEVLVAGTAYEESNYLNDSCQDQKHFLDCVGRLENCAEQVGRLFPEEDKKKSISDKPQCSPVVSSITRQNLESTNKQLSDCRKDSKDEILSNAVRREQVHQTIEVEEKVSEARDFDALYHVEAEYIAANKSPPAKGIDDHQTESFAVNKFPPAKEIDNNKTGSCSETQKSTKELVKAIHSSSVELLSTNFCNNYELDPRDHRLLYSVINNISLVLKDKKDLVGSGPSGHCSCMNAASCFNRCSHAKDVSRSNMKGKICSVVRNNVNNESGSLFPEGGDADLKKVQHVTQTFENVLSETFSEREENAQTSLYKNLWIEAEVAICKLKYALQLALRRTESENFRPTPSDVSSSLPFLHDLREHNSPLKASEGSVSSKLNESEDVELSVTARAKVLKDRIVSSSDKSTQGQGTVDPKVAGICPGDYENIHGSPDVENNSATNELPTDFAELGFMNGAAQPYARCYAAADDDFGPRINICSNTTQMYSDSMNGSPIWSYMTYQQGTWPRTRGHENPSAPFDWEHVPREEATQ